MKKSWQSVIAVFMVVVVLACLVDWPALAASEKPSKITAASEGMEIISTDADDNGILITGRQGQQTFQLRLVFLKDGGIRLYDKQACNDVFQEAVDSLTDTFTVITNTAGILQAEGASSASYVNLEYQNSYAWQLDICRADKSVAYTIDADDLLFTYNSNGRTTVTLKGEIASGEQFIGLGERYTGAILNGATYPLWNYDGWSAGLNGDRTTSYANVPLLHSSAGYSLFFNSYYNAQADIGCSAADEYQLDFEGPDLDIFLWTGSPLENLKSYMAVTGTTATIPKWATGYWAGGSTTHYWKKNENGVTTNANYAQRLQEVLENYKNLGTMPYAVYGETIAMETLNEVMNVSDSYGVKMLGWHRADAVWSTTGQVRTVQEGLLEEEFGLPTDNLPAAKTVDGEYIKDEGANNNLILDYAHENITTLLTKEYQKGFDAGLAGLMVDFGEYVLKDSVFANGQTGAERHNMQAYYYNQALKNVWDSSKMVDDYVLFARAGSAGSQQYAAQFGGDQKSNFEGLRQAIMGGLSASASGFSIWGSDIGGLGNGATITNDNPKLTAELYLRWLGFGTFSTLMRTHGTQDHDPWTFDEEVIEEGLDVDVQEVFKKYYWTRENLSDAIYSATLQSNKDGTPPMQMMGLAFPEYFSVEDEFMFCNEILVAPIYQEALDGDGGSVTREITLPKGTWYDLWSGEAIESDGESFVKMVAVEDTPAYLRSGLVMPLDISTKTYRISDSMNELDKKQALLLTPAEDGESRTSTWYIGETAAAPQYQYTSTTDDTSYTIQAEQGDNATVLCGYGMNPEHVTVDGVGLAQLYSLPTGGQTGFYVDESTNQLVIVLPDGEWNEITMSREVVWDYEFDLEENADITFLDDAFDVYKYGLLVEGAKITAKIGPVAPSDIDPNASGRTYFTTDDRTNWSHGYLRPSATYGSITSSASNGPGYYNTLTYKNSKFTDFEAEFELLAGYTQFGLAFGAGDAGVFPVSLDNNSKNDTGVILYTTNNGGLYAGGVLDVDTFENVGFDNSVTNYSSSCLAKTNNFYVSQVSKITTEKDPTDSSPVQHICVRVKDNVMTVWDKAMPDKYVSIHLNSNYQGGYVSLLANSYTSGAFKSFRIRSLDSDYSYSYDLKQMDISELDEIFHSYYMESVNGNNGKPYTVNAGSPSEYWSTTEGKLMPVHNKQDRNKVAYLTYQKTEVYDFETKVTLQNNVSEYGIVVSPAGKMFSEGSSLGVYITSKGEIHIVGEIDAESATCTGGLELSPYHYGNAASLWVDKYADFEQDFSYKSRKPYTLCMKHKDGMLSVWVEEYPDQMIILPTTEKYQGGYISLYSLGRYASYGGFEKLELNTYAGDTIYLDKGRTKEAMTFTVRTDVPYSNIHLSAKYDSTVYQYQNAIAADGTTADVRQSGNGELQLYLKSQNETNYVGKWVTLVFGVKDETKADSYLQSVIVQTANATGESRFAGIEQAFPGDVNDDNYFDIRDLVHMKLAMQGEDVSVSEKNSQLNINTQITSKKNVALLRKRLLLR